MTTSDASFERSDSYGATPSIHALRADPPQWTTLQAVSVVLRFLQEDFPILGESDTLFFGHPTEDELQLLVDLRCGIDPKVTAVVETLFREVAFNLGMVSESFGPDIQSRTEQGSTGSSPRKSGNEDEQKAWDTNVFPANHWRLKTEQERIALIEQLKEQDNVLDLANLRMLGMLCLDAQRWQAAEDSGRLLPLPPESIKMMARHSMSLFSCAEQAFPGITHRRFNALSVTQRNALLDHMNPAELLLLSMSPGPAPRHWRGPKP